MATMRVLIRAVLLVWIVAEPSLPTRALDDPISHSNQSQSGSINRGNAQGRTFDPFTWAFRFDGTDANLSGLSKMYGASTDLQPKIFLSFDCSKRWIRVSISSNEYGNTEIAQSSSLFVNGERFVGTTTFGPDIRAATTTDQTDSAFVKRISKLTQAFITTRLIDLNLRSGAVSFEYHMLDSDFMRSESRSAVASFREKCSNWWPDF